MTKTRRHEIIKMINANTDYSAVSVKFHRDGTITALKDADKTLKQDGTRYLVCRVSDFDNNANPFVA